jgi:Bacterial Ig-like domain (group 2)
MMHYRLLLTASIAVLAGACDGLAFLAPRKVCTLELRTRFSPADTTIRVAQSFQASVQLSSCGGAEQLTDLITWRAEDPSVAIVDGRSGRVVGQGPGTTRIFASGQRYGNVGGLLVSVQAAP